MSGHHHHDHSHELSERGLYWALIINVLLTVVQLIGGVISGSLSLIADALHNFSDAGALGIAALARKIGKTPPSKIMTYGFRRAEILGALINSTLLLAVGCYLIYQAGYRFYNPHPIDGWIVIWVASVALVIDLLTAALTYFGSKESLNIRAAFIHNISDAFASLIVIISGTLILLFEVYYVDVIATVAISIFILHHAYNLLKECISILMQSVPSQINVEEVSKCLEKINFINNVHHIHIWQLDDKRTFFEGHVVMSESDISKMEQVKEEIRHVLKEQFGISHSTLEIETCETCNNKH